MVEKQSGIVLPRIKSLDKEALLLKLIGKDRMCCPECGRFYEYNSGI